MSNNWIRTGREAVGLSQASSTFTAIRDTLLPKLPSSEVRIPDAERFVEEAV